MENARNTGRISARAITVIATTAVLVVVSFLIIAPIPQDLAYHDFADARPLLGVRNFYNVVSNLPFLIVGAFGLAYLQRHAQSVCVTGLQAAYQVLFAGVLVTAFGSGFYHLAPDNQSLVWDRLPMTIAFAGLFTIIVGEYVSVPVARRLLIPLIGIGLFSVVYWATTEAGGNGDLRPYAIVQFLPMLLIPVILYTYQPAFGASKYFWLMIVFYIIAKLFEHLDAEVFAVGELLSGHTLKHLLGALAPATFLYALSRRRYHATPANRADIAN